MVTDKDEQVLKHLVDIKLSYLDNNPGFKLDFYFDGSDACKQWFSNDVLSKTYYLTSSADSNISEVVYDRAEG